LVPFNGPPLPGSVVNGAWLLKLSMRPSKNSN
jgi:hypothetical protein